MGRYEKAIAKSGLQIGGQCSGMPADEIVALTFDDDPLVRRLAAKALCPCQVKSNIPKVWDRLLELTSDPDPGVRRDVVHALADGSPRERASEIAEALRGLSNDPDRKVRRNVQLVLRAYRRTGRVNVL